MACGLPDLQGHTEAIAFQTTSVGVQYGVDVFKGTIPEAQNADSGGRGTSSGKIKFAASNFNSIYGASDVVQPLSTSMLPIIKF